eukprot:353077-Chlamydomonas_euryale.AAC.9
MLCTLHFSPHYPASISATAVPPSPSPLLCICVQEEERERRLDYVPDESALNTSAIEVDPTTVEMLKAMNLPAIMSGVTVQQWGFGEITYWEAHLIASAKLGWSVGLSTLMLKHPGHLHVHQPIGRATCPHVPCVFAYAVHCASDSGIKMSAECKSKAIWPKETQQCQHCFSCLVSGQTRKFCACMAVLPGVHAWQHSWTPAFKFSTPAASGLTWQAGGLHGRLGHWVLKYCVLAGQLLVHARKRGQLVFGAVTVPGVEVHLECLGAVNAVPCTLTDNLSRVHQVVQDGAMHLAGQADRVAGLGWERAWAC